MSKVVLNDVVKRYPNGFLGVDHVSLDVADGEFLSFLGPSGCGKTSTMRMISGLEDISSGSIYIGDTLVNNMPPSARNVAMAFENYGLYPHMTLFANIAYPLRIRKMSDNDIGREVVRISRLLHIEDLLDRKPGEISGGVRQRVSLARALVRNPSVFLLDEPLSHLDAELRSDMRAELKRLHVINHATTIYVTHDQLEAMTMSDRIAVMNAGVFQQVGTPTEIFYLPADRFVASFIGEPPMNILQGTVQPGAGGAAATILIGGEPFLNITGELARAVVTAAAADGQTVDVGVRPPDFHMAVGYAGAPTGGEASQGLSTRVRIREFMGENLLLTVEKGDLRIRMVVSRDTQVQEGDPVTIYPREDRVHFFATTSGQAIGHTTERPVETGSEAVQQFAHA